jgi:hypothetical protein
MPVTQERDILLHRIPQTPSLCMLDTARSNDRTNDSSFVAVSTRQAFSRSPVAALDPPVAAAIEYFRPAAGATVRPCLGDLVQRSRRTKRSHRQSVSCEYRHSAVPVQLRGCLGNTTILKQPPTRSSLFYATRFRSHSQRAIPSP